MNIKARAKNGGILPGNKRVFAGRASRLACVGALTLSSLTAGTSPALSARPHSSGFGAIPTQWTFQGCTISAGRGWDNWHDWPGFHFIGAGEVNCEKREKEKEKAPWIGLTVRQYRLVNGVEQPADRARGWGPDQAFKVFIPTEGACKGGYPRARFRTGVKVTIDGVDSGWLYSPWRGDDYGCR